MRMTVRTMRRMMMMKQQVSVSLCRPDSRQSGLENCAAPFRRRQQQLSRVEKNKTKQRCDLGKTSTADETQRERLQRSEVKVAG